MEIRYNYKLIIGLIIGVILFGGSAYATILYSSNIVFYNNNNSNIVSTNVQGAIEELAYLYSTPPVCPLPSSSTLESAYAGIDPSISMYTVTYFLSTNIGLKRIESVTFSDSLDGHLANGNDCWDVGKIKNGTVLAWATDSDGDGKYEITIGSVGGVKANPDSSSLFDNMSNVTSITGLSNFDTSSATNMENMFNDAINLTSLDVSNFDTSNVTNMASMFHGLYKLSSLNVSNFDTTNVTNMQLMFWNMRNLTSLDVSNFNTSSATNMAAMFSEMPNITSLNVSSWNTTNVTDMGSMFFNLNNVTSLDVSNWNTSKVIDMGGMFSETWKLTSLDVSNFNTSSATNMDRMFFAAANLTSLNVSSWNTSSVKYMNNMFARMFDLTSLNVSNFDTSNVVSMGYMFSGMTNLTSLDLSNFNTSNVKYMSGMFSLMSNLTDLNVSGWNTSSATNMASMFSGCSYLTNLDLGGWNTSNVKNMSYMFSSCSNLTTVYVGNNWNTTKVADSANMFSGDSSIVGGMGTVYDASNINKAYAHIDGGSADPGYFTAAGSSPYGATTTTTVAVTYSCYYCSGEYLWLPYAYGGCNSTPVAAYSEYQCSSLNTSSSSSSSSSVVATTTTTTTKAATTTASVCVPYTVVGACIEGYAQRWVDYVPCSGNSYHTSQIADSSCSATTPSETLYTKTVKTCNGQWGPGTNIQPSVAGPFTTTNNQLCQSECSSRISAGTLPGTLESASFSGGYCTCYACPNTNNYVWQNNKCYLYDNDISSFSSDVSYHQTSCTPTSAFTCTWSTRNTSYTECVAE